MGAAPPPINPSVPALPAPLEWSAPWPPPPRRERLDEPQIVRDGAGKSARNDQGRGQGRRWMGAQANDDIVGQGPLAGRRIGENIVHNPVLRGDILRVELVIMCGNSRRRNPPTAEGPPPHPPTDVPSGAPLRRRMPLPRQAPLPTLTLRNVGGGVNPIRADSAPNSNFSYASCRHGMLNSRQADANPFNLRANKTSPHLWPPTDILRSPVASPLHEMSLPRNFHRSQH